MSGLVLLYDDCLVQLHLQALSCLTNNDVQANTQRRAVAKEALTPLQIWTGKVEIRQRNKILEPPNASDMGDSSGLALGLA
jgi:hypothetical protein